MRGKGIKYSEEDLAQAKGFLEEGASYNIARRLTEVCSQTLSKHFPGHHTQKSEVYPPITKFSENRLREAAEREMDLNQASVYACVSKRSVRTVWQRIGHNYITPDQAEKIHQGISWGANKPQIARHAGIYASDLEYFLRLEQLELNPYNQSNPLATPAASRGSPYPTTVRQDVRRLLEEGESYAEITRLTGVYYYTIKRWFPEIHRERVRLQPEKTLTVLESTVEYLSRVLAATGQDSITDRQLLGRLGRQLRHAAEKGLVEIERVGDEWFYRMKKPTNQL